MLTLGIETSCDETAAAVVKNGKTILSSCVSSSIHLHRKFGGIVPEIASRFHLEYIAPVTKTALTKAKVRFSDIDLIAVTHAPGLLGSLLVGVSFAKALSFGLQKPLLGINHVHAHLFAPFLSKGRSNPLRLPFIGLAVSGGHTNLMHVRDFNKINVIGKTRDDAAGEAFDKVAKTLELGYPGGPVIDALAKTVTASPFRFSCARLPNTLDFSFSGIKTDVLYTWKKIRKKNKKTQAHIAHAFQKAIVHVLIEKSIAACKKYTIRTLSVGGGVACNSLLRRLLSEEGKKEHIRVFFAEPGLCLDNAAMIASVGHYLFKKGLRSDYRLSALARIQ